MHNFRMRCKIALYCISLNMNVSKIKSMTMFVLKFTQYHRFSSSSTRFEGVHRRRESLICVNTNHSNFCARKRTGGGLVRTIPNFKLMISLKLAPQYCYPFMAISFKWTWVSKKYRYRFRNNPLYKMQQWWSYWSTVYLFC